MLSLSRLTWAAYEDIQLLTEEANRPWIPAPSVAGSVRVPSVRLFDPNQIPYT